jgi:uncharacterized DUF497 family protein
MRITWNPKKRLTNLRKHGLDFADAERIFSGHTLLRPDRRFDYGEARFSTMGLLGATVVVIAHTESGGKIHIISMRKAERHEQENYFKSL